LPVRDRPWPDWPSTDRPLCDVFACRAEAAGRL